MKPLFVAAFAVLVLAGCNRNVAGESTAGKQVFANVCAACHGPQGKPNEAMVARLGVKDLTDPVERQKLTPAFVEHQVRDGSQNKLMPALGAAMSDAQVKAVAEFVASPQFLAP